MISKKLQDQSKMYGSQIVLFGVGLAVALSFLLNPKTTNQLFQPSPQRFDYFVLALQWPTTFCNLQLNKRTKCYPYPLLLQHRDKFTIHGLWPQLNDGESLMDCSPPDGMTQMQDSDLTPFGNDLLHYWPNLFSAGRFHRSKSFWQNQWKKHGICSSYKFNKEEYLRITINLAKRYAKRIFDELGQRGIRADGTTPRRVSDIREAVKQITGSYPIIHIQLNGTIPLLHEIHLCVEKDGLTLFDCDPLYRFTCQSM